MPRIASRKLLLLLLALPLASCFDDVKTCSTCPPDLSASLEVTLPQTSLLDSVQVSVDGGATLTVRRGRHGAVERLSGGSHQVKVVRWFSSEGIASSKTSYLEVVLERGETRFITFHNDFPLITWSPLPATGRAGTPVLAESAALRLG